MNAEMLYIFQGAENFWATTADPTGSNLPSAYAPWNYVKPIARTDPRIEQGGDRGTLAEVEAKGYSLRQITVTFEPSVTVPQTVRE